LCEYCEFDDIAHLLEKVTKSEERVALAEAYYKKMMPIWAEELHGEEIAAYFLDILERKKDQIDYEWYRIDQMGRAIASGRHPGQMDI
jgi:hypothetical protein